MNTRNTSNGINGTWAQTWQPWGKYIKARVMCPDGKVRNTNWISETADTFFSVPCSVPVRLNGKRTSVSGYMTVNDSVEGGTEYQFVPYTYGKNWWMMTGTEPHEMPTRVTGFFTPQPLRDWDAYDTEVHEFNDGTVIYIGINYSTGTRYYLAFDKQRGTNQGYIKGRFTNWSMLPAILQTWRENRMTDAELQRQ